MNDPTHPEEAIFEAAIALPASERAAYVDRTCGGNAGLRRLVEALLEAHEEAGEFLEQPAPGAEPAPAPGPQSPRAGSVTASASVEKPGDRIGRYKLLQQIGEGGCGVVYMAEQEKPVRRQVALKVIKLGMDTKSVIARFEAERQALALMDHPNIAKVLDAGATETGRPYFVMELVRGVKITDYCDQNNLSTRQRLDLFVQVCQAIQHAHQKGVIHRDIKPSNILVTQRDGVPVPKVIDFGIAKATTDQRLTDKTLFTAFEQFIGTPAYMSPEQAEMSELGIDTRSDIYSLGVLLYELLTGQTPFDAKELLQAGLDAMRRIIREQEPARPSTRLGTLLEAERTSVANHRQTDAPKLVNLLRGDLDWIVIKSLEKDRARRYETANGLAMDVQRHLNDEPVVARPPSNWYRFQKLVRRNKLAFIALMTVTGALALGFGISTWQFIAKGQSEREQNRLRVEAEGEKRKAQTAAAESQEVAQLLKDMLQGVGPSVALGRDTILLREILDRTAKRIGLVLTNQPAAEVEIRLTLASTYDEMGLYPQMEEMARESLRLARSRLGETNRVVAYALFQLGAARMNLDDLVQAEALTREAIAFLRKLPPSEDVELEIGKCLNTLGLVLWKAGKPNEAVVVDREALGIARKYAGNDSGEAGTALNNLAQALAHSGNMAEAEPLFREAVALQRKRFGNEHPKVSSALNNLALLLGEENKLEEAETMQRETLAIERKVSGDEHPHVALAMNNLALTLQQQRKLDEAEDLQKGALAMQRKLLGNESDDVATSLNNLAIILSLKNRPAEAETLYKESLAIIIKRRGLEHPQAATVRMGVAMMLKAQGKLTEAEAMMREALELQRKLLGDDHHEVALMFNNLGDVLQQEGKLADAEVQYLQTLRIIRKRFRAEDLRLEQFILKLAGLFQIEVKYAEAEALFREVVQKQRIRLPSGDSELGGTLAQLALTLISEEKFNDAETVARESLEIREKQMPDDWRTFNSRSVLGGCLLGQKKYAEAEPLVLSGYDGMIQRTNQIPPVPPVRLTEARRRVVALYQATGRAGQAAEVKDP